MTNQRGARGLSLVEIIVVVAILSLVLLAVLASLPRSYPLLDGPGLTLLAEFRGLLRFQLRSGGERVASTGRWRSGVGAVGGGHGLCGGDAKPVRVTPGRPEWCGKWRGTGAGGCFHRSGRVSRAHVPKTVVVTAACGRLKGGSHVADGGPRGLMVARSFISAPQCGQRGTGGSGRSGFGSSSWPQTSARTSSRVVRAAPLIQP